MGHACRRRWSASSARRRLPLDLAGSAVRAAGRSVQPEAPWPPDAQEVGRIVDAWGVKGWVKVEPYSSQPQALVSTQRWHLKRGDAAAVSPAVVRPCPLSIVVAQVRAHGEFLVAKPCGSDDRTSAEALRGARIFVSRAEFPATDVDEFYWVDLIGLAVFNRADEPLGEVVGLIDTGPHCVLRVEPPAGEERAAEAGERLIPFVDAYVDTVDIPGRRIVVDWGTDY